MKEPMLTIPQVATKLSVSNKTVHRMIDRGELKGVNVGLGNARPRWRVTEASLTRFLNRRRRKA